MRIDNAEGKVQVKSEYNKKFVARAKQLGGKWNGSNKSWDFPEKLKERVENLVKDVYGYLPEDKSQTKTIEIKAIDFIDKDDFSVKVGTILVAKRWNRDKPVQLYNAYVSEGELPASGGSAAWPSVNPDKNVKIVVNDVPLTILDSIEEEYEIISNNVNGKQDTEQAYLEEKEQLIKRIKEIDVLIAKTRSI